MPIAYSSGGKLKKSFMSIKKLLLLTLFAFGVFMCANAQDYYIEGFYERHGAGQYTLKNVRTNGIYLNGKTSLSETIRGSKERILCDGLEATMVQFSFERATTDCPTKWENGFVFQYWDDDNGVWKTDVEACKGQSTGYSQKDMVIMLVLDYSYSMKTNIPRLQKTAIELINSICSASNGNVHIGIIAFSGMDLAQNQFLPITPLTSGNKYKFEDFIRNSNKGKETALYYSMDHALNMIESYVNQKGFKEENFNGTCMITFTDGLDNASINDNISVSMHRGRKNEYLSYLNGILGPSSTKTILGMPIESFAIGYTGSEEFTNDDKAFFEEVLMRLTPDGQHFKLASDFKEVEAYFGYITQQLTDRWETLNMYVGESQYGQVRWLLNCGKPVRVETPRPLPPIKPKNKVRFNINLGLTTMNVKETYYGQTDKYSLAGKKDATTKGVYLGVSWDMSFKYGLGIEFADLGFAYYKETYNDDYNMGTIKATSLNIYVSPIKFQYRYDTPSTFAFFAATGPALDYCVDYSVKYEDWNFTSSDTYKSLYLYWDLKGGVAYKFMKLTLGTSLRMNNVAKTTSGEYYPSDYTAKVGRPFYLMFSFVF